MQFSEVDFRYAKLCAIKIAFMKEKWHVVADLLQFDFLNINQQLAKINTQETELRMLEELHHLQATTCNNFRTLQLYNLEDLNKNLQSNAGIVCNIFVDKAKLELERNIRDKEWTCSGDDGQYTQEDLNSFEAYRMNLWEKNKPQDLKNNKDVAALERLIVLKMQEISVQRDKIKSQKSVVMTKIHDVIAFKQLAVVSRPLINTVMIGRPEYANEDVKELITQALRNDKQNILIEPSDLDGEGLSFSYYLLDAVNKCKNENDAKVLLEWGLKWYLEHNKLSDFFEVQDGQGQKKLISDPNGHTLIDQIVCSRWEDVIFPMIIGAGFKLPEHAITHTLISKNKSLLHVLVDRLYFDLLSHIRSPNTIDWLLEDGDGNTLIDCVMKKIEQHKPQLLLLSEAKNLNGLKMGDKIPKLYSMLESLRTWYDELKNKENEPREGGVSISPEERAVLYLIDNAKAEHEQMQAQGFLFQVLHRLFSGTAPSKESILAMELVLFSSTLRQCDVGLYDGLMQQKALSKSWTATFKDNMGQIITSMQNIVGFAHPNFQEMKEARDVLVKSKQLPENARFDDKQYKIVAAHVANAKLVEIERVAKEQALAREAIEKKEKEESLVREAQERAAKEQERAEKEAALKRLAELEAQVAAMQGSATASVVVERGFFANKADNQVSGILAEKQTMRAELQTTTTVIATNPQ